MMRWPILMLCGLALLAAGCQSGGNTALMERELRLQEDRIYFLEDELARQQALLDACRAENATLQQAEAAEKMTTPRPTPAGPRLDRPQLPAPPERPLPQDLRPPEVELDIPPPTPAPGGIPPLPQADPDQSAGKEPQRQVSIRLLTDEPRKPPPAQTTRRPTWSPYR